MLVVKIGGGAGVDLQACAADLAHIAAERPVVVVHGVSDRLNRLCELRGVPVRTITSPNGHSSRYTDPETRTLYVEAAGSANAELVHHLREFGADAIGFPGEHTPLTASRKEAIRAVVDGRVRLIRDDYSGTITGVRIESILAALRDGLTPAVAPLANSADGLLNVDGDRAAAAVAAALGARDLIILSNVRGLYQQFGDEASFVERVGGRDIEVALDWAQGRMKRKVLGAQEALEGGVTRVLIADGRTSHPVTRALAGNGTEFTR
ncbi:MAG: [LysW]-aminoadipate kinase [Chloroflexi bacterium]|nr:[LysW]-aminoadipate kinase [Chloroflexota bacterium]